MDCAYGGLGGHGSGGDCWDVYYEESGMFMCFCVSHVSMVVG